MKIFVHRFGSFRRFRFLFMMLTLGAIASTAACQTATPATTVLGFAPAAVGVSAGSAQTLTASFTVSGYVGSFTPTATVHYGLSYTIGAVSCTSGSTETCTVPVTFLPRYPGARRDAIFLMNGSTRLATMLLNGVGQAPFAMLQPGIVTSPVVGGASYFYNSVVDENGTDYVLATEGNAVYSVTASGTVTALAIAGLNSPRAIAIDGAGVLYIADQTYNGPTITYDTVQGVQGSIAFPPGEGYNQALALGDTGNLFETSGTNIYEESEYGGPITTVPINPAITQAYALIVDSSENVFIGGYAENELLPNGTQTQINTINAQNGYEADAADTLYIGRFSSGSVSESVGMIPASNAWTANIGAGLDSGSSPLGLGLGGDGTLWVGNYSNLDKVDRTQGALSLNAINPNQPATPQTAYVYNGGNQPLSLTSFSVSGDPDFTLTPPTSGACTAGMPVPAGGICGVVVNFTAPSHGGVYNGILSFVSNSLNASTTQAVTLTDTVTGAYVTPNTNTLSFGSQAVGATSAAMTVTFTNNGYGASGEADSYTSSSGAFQVTIPSACYSIAVGSSCTASVTFTPAAATNYSGTITFAESYGNIVIAVTGVGTSPTASVSLAPNPVTFAAQQAGSTSAAQTVTLSNSGGAALSISGVTISGTNASSFTQTNNCGSTVNAGSSCAISITFSPSAAGAYTATVNVADNATGSPQSVTLNGTGTAPQVSLLPSPLIFGDQLVGTMSAAQKVTLANNGTAALNVTSIALTGTNASAFSQTNTCGATVAAGSSCSITAIFAPTTVGSFSGSINVSDNVTGSPQSVALSGTGTAPQAALAPSLLSFNNQTTGTTSAVQNVTLSNAGTAALSITSIVLSGGTAASFSQTNNCGASLAASASCTIAVTFAPTALGAASTTLAVTDSVAGPQTLAISGTGVVPAAPVAVLTPSSLSFATTNVGSTAATQTLTLSNTGNAPMLLSGVSIAGANASSFSETNNCGSSVSAGGSCTITVSFTPSTAGPLSGMLSVADNATTSPQSASLAGTGSASDFSLSPSPATQTVNAGGNGMFTVTVAAVSGNLSGPVTLAAAGIPGATITFSPASVSSSGASGTSVMTVQTTTAMALLRRQGEGSGGLLVVALAPLLLLRRRMLRHSLAGSRVATVALFALLGLAGASLTGCGGGFVLPSHTYAITVTGASATNTHTATVNLTVQ